jgi:ribosome-associated protein
VELLFDLRGSPSLDEAQRALLSERLRPYLDQEGVLHLVSQATRSQLRNREDVLARFALLLQRSLRPTRPRRPTAPSRAARERRLAGKRVRSAAKSARQRVHDEE